MPPEIGSHAKCMKERKLALIAKGRLKELLAEKGLRVVSSGAVDRTPSQHHYCPMLIVTVTARSGALTSKRFLATLAKCFQRSGLCGPQHA